MEGTLAEIRMFAGNFSPRGWQLCNGQLLSISQWTAVFALVGTIYGGNGQTTFGLPDFRGRSPFGTGNGAGLSPVQLGEISGTESITLLASNLPAHNHTLTPANLSVGSKAERIGTSDLPTTKFNSILNANSAYSTTSDVSMAALNTPSLGIAGGSQPFSNRSPYLGINFIICVEGIFPSRD